MYLTDEELCMIEQLAYLDEAVAKVAGINKIFSKINMVKHKDKAICDILVSFDNQALTKLMMHSESICDGARSYSKKWQMSLQIVTFVILTIRLTECKINYTGNDSESLKQ